jgi:hypothetical protein
MNDTLIKKYHWHIELYSKRVERKSVCGSGKDHTQQRKDALKKQNKGRKVAFFQRDSGCECAHYSTTSHSLALLVQWQKQQGCRVAVGRASVLCAACARSSRPPHYTE